MKGLADPSNKEKKELTSSKPPRSPHGKSGPTASKSGTNPSKSITTPVKSTDAPGKAGDASVSTPSNTPMKNGSMYERSLQRLVITESKLKQLECTMMKSCTFSPDTSKSNIPKKTSDTKKSSVVHSRDKATTPENMGSRKSPGSTSSRSTVSNRVDELYRDGVIKNKQRFMTAKEEDDARAKRLQERELAECTFQPNLNCWKAKRGSPDDSKKSDRFSVEAPKSARSVKVPIKVVGMVPPSEVTVVSPLRHAAVGPLKEHCNFKMLDFDQCAEGTE